MTESSRGGVTKMSPKEYSYINKTQINKRTYSVKNKKNYEKVHLDTKNSIFKTRLYEIFDNMNVDNTIQDIVEEGAYKTIKEIMVNRVGELSESFPRIDIDLIAGTVKNDFPYEGIPEEPVKARTYYVNKLCDMVINSIYTQIKN